MYVLHVTIKLRPDAAAPLSRLFSGPFTEAISRQAGFRDVTLLRPTSTGDYVLSIAFESSVSQQGWVATDVHTRLWAEMEKHFESYNLTSYTSV